VCCKSRRSPFDTLRTSGPWIPLVVSLPALSTAEGSNHEQATWVYGTLLGRAEEGIRLIGHQDLESARHDP
jgi:hypothetical protein